jgi:Fe-S cluster assembly iron-binding protein IscA
MSDDAAGLIRSLVAGSDLPGAAGLRLGTDDETQSLAMNLAALPREHDLVLVHEGASLFVSPLAAPRLEDRTLHAQLGPRPAFFLD